MAPKLDLVGTFEIERDYGIPKRQINRLTVRGLWPRPLAELRAGRVWNRVDVERALPGARRREAGATIAQ